MKAISDAHGRFPASFAPGPEAPAVAAGSRPQTHASVASSPPEALASVASARAQALASARYRPLLELGRGGMSRVYVAESLRSEVQKLVVLKVLNPEFAVDPEMRAAFRREAELSACLNHPNIVQVFEVFEQAGRPVIVMQYLDGVPLSEVLHRSARELPLVLHLQVLAHLLSGLHYFHELRDGDDVALNCVHRDVSPQNVLVLHEGGVKVLDFGIAKIHTLTQPQTRVGIVKGKIRYMPAEQLLGTTGIDRRADIYSVGVMLWEAVAGRRMWRGMEETEIMRAIVRGQLPSIYESAPGISEELAAVIERALALDRDERYASAREMQLDLEQAMPTAQGCVATRRMAEHMHKHFGEDRRMRQLAIKVALHAPATGLAAAALEAACPADESEATFANANSPSRRGGLSARRVAAALAVLTCLAWIGLTLDPPWDVPDPARVRGAARLQGSPDARHDTREPASRQEAADARDPAGVRESATQPAATSTGERGAQRPGADDARTQEPAREQKSHAHGRAHEPKAEHEREAEAHAHDRCHPPYSLAPDGVKIFRAECF